MSENNWRWCNRCQGLFSAGTGSLGGVHPAKGIHSEAGSGNYVLAESGSGHWFKGLERLCLWIA
jgi:hypothetical protein